MKSINAPCHLFTAVAMLEINPTAPFDIGLMVFVASSFLLYLWSIIGKWEKNMYRSIYIKCRLYFYSTPGNESSIYSWFYLAKELIGWIMCILLLQPFFVCLISTNSMIYKVMNSLGFVIKSGQIKSCLALQRFTKHIGTRFDQNFNCRQVSLLSCPM